MSLVLELLFLSQTPSNFFEGYIKDAAPCQWGRVAVFVRAGDGGNLRGQGELVLW